MRKISAWITKTLAKMKQNNRESKLHNKILKLKAWKNLKIGQKFAVAFSITTILFAISSVIIFFQLSMVQNEMKNVQQDGDNAIIITEMATTFQELGSEVRLYIQSNDIKHLNGFELKKTEFDEQIKQVEAAMETESMKKMYSSIVNNKEILVALFNESVVPAVKEQQMIESRKFATQSDELISLNLSLLNELRDSLKTQSSNSVSNATSSIGATIFVLIASIVIATIIGISIMLFISRQLTKQFTNLIDVSENIAKGNLNVDEIEASGKDEVSVLSRAINEMRNSLQSMIQEITAVSTQVTEKSEILTVSSNEVKAASQQVSSTMQELSTGAEEQANTANLLTELMENFTNRIQIANSNGQHINQSSVQVLEMTQKGNLFMNESTEQMNKINEIMKTSVEKVNGLDTQTKQISTLVKVIKDIADQTNLLALNAAIEAARAGDHGRGFAVVADEVRKLAVQVADSVSDITDIVGSIQQESKSVADSLQLGYKEVEIGTQKIDITGQTFSDINVDVTKMVDNIKGISEHLLEVTNNTVEINSSIENIASVSEESAAGIEQTSASVQQTNSAMENISEHAEVLSELAVQLNTMILKFKL
ncbi:methyl-accepting chemotaxis protein [Bacillus sp. PS06]|uniref:methyl-accepting chemotaxis protein n=1 Tax=Bacillus sp. PS06 TaxID=2764176 RepID=UPI00177FFBF0|nr:HAMP domain-containing methyl-accepting chemotaxis protein [Bacillus sp. PS06]MBD8067434.1 methyl-accepting chemotaxis protein [Bacillus sp. PS06]